MTSPTENLPEHQSSRPSAARSAAKGMLWVSVALAVSKLLSFLSQIVLGHVMSVETYGSIAVVTTALALVAGFQNSGINKALIRRGADYPAFYASYCAFTLRFGVIGMVIMIFVGAIFTFIYPIPNIFSVIALASTTVPLMALALLMTSPLNISYRFRELNFIEIRRALLYYLVLIAAACLGFEAYSIAMATLAGAILQLFLIRRYTPELTLSWALPWKEFFRIFKDLRWLILAAFLMAMSMRSDLLVLGTLISPLDLGYYSFGFMLMTSMTIPISAGISQVCFPIFAQMQSQPMLLKKEILRFSNAIVILGGLVCLLLLGVSSNLVHLIWGGKWDPSLPVIMALSLVMPFRFLALVSATGLESRGLWKIRNIILIGEAILLCIMAAVGATFWGLQGAIIGTSVQRVLGSIISFGILAHSVGLPKRNMLLFSLRTYLPFFSAAGLLCMLDPARLATEMPTAALLPAILETFAALFLYMLLCMLLNRSAFATLSGLALSKIRKRRA